MIRFNVSLHRLRILHSVFSIELPVVSQTGIERLEMTPYHFIRFARGIKIEVVRLTQHEIVFVSETPLDHA